MKQEFITANGKATVENGIIKIKSLKDSYNYQFYKYLIWVIIGAAVVLEESKPKPVGYFLIVSGALVLLVYLLRFFYLNQWKSKFKIERIKSYKVQDDGLGLETTVTLYFQSGTAKEILFRMSENQHQPFLQLIEEYLTKPQLA